MAKSSAPSLNSAPHVLEVRPAGPDHQVVSFTAPAKEGLKAYRRTPCGGCPWREDQCGQFPPEAFLHSARTAYDMSQHLFSCHESGSNPGSSAICAGFLLRGADHNLGVRLALMNGTILQDVNDKGLVLHANYRAMAVANGADPQAEELRLCRD